MADGDSCFGVDPNYLIISNDDQYNSMRVGLSTEFMLTDRLKFVADAAYVPLVDMSGVDNHNARAAYFPETDSDGYGTMMEGNFSLQSSPTIGMSAPADATGPGPCVTALRSPFSGRGIVPARTRTEQL